MQVAWLLVLPEPREVDHDETKVCLLISAVSPSWNNVYTSLRRNSNG